VPVVDKSIDPGAGVARELVLMVGENVPISQSAVLFDSVVPGFGFKVERIECIIQSITAVLTFQVLIGTTALCAATAPTAATLAEVTLTASGTDLIGTDTEALNLKVTTDGSGVGEGLKVRVHLRPYPMGGEL
jgi:hypothetical protein